jgi:hypothetical protein
LVELLIKEVSIAESPDPESIRTRNQPNILVRALADAQTLHKLLDWLHKARPMLHIMVSLELLDHELGLLVLSAEVFLLELDCGLDHCRLEMLVHATCLYF